MASLLPLTPHIHSLALLPAQGTGLVNLSGLGGLTLGGMGVTTTPGGAAPSSVGAGGRPQSNYLMLVNIPNILGELDVSNVIYSSTLFCSPPLYLVAWM